MVTNDLFRELLNLVLNDSDLLLENHGERFMVTDKKPLLDMGLGEDGKASCR